MSKWVSRETVVLFRFRQRGRASSYATLTQRADRLIDEVDAMIERNPERFRDSSNPEMQAMYKEYQKVLAARRARVNK